MANWYCSSVVWSALTARANNTAYSVGDIRKQDGTVTAGNERVYRCTTGGTSGGTTPTWTYTKGTTVADGANVVWTEITGTDIYNGDGGGTAWGAPAARVETLLASGWAAAGDNIFVASNHAESWTTSRTWSGVGTPTSPIRVISVDETVVPSTDLVTVKAGASFTTTVGSNTGLFLTGSSTTLGALYVYGFNINVGNATSSAVVWLGATAATLCSIVLDTCNLTVVGTGTAGGIKLGSAPGSTTLGGYSKLKNCVIKFAAVAQGIFFGIGEQMIEGCSIDGASSICTNLFKTTDGIGFVSPKIYACDLSRITTTLFDLSNSTFAIDALVSNCKLGSGVAMYSGTITKKGRRIRVQNCDSGATNYRDYLAEAPGTITEETTIVRSGGASDGVTGLSWAMVTGTICNIINPLRSDWFVQWIDTTGSSKTLTIECAGDASLTNADAWIEVEYMGSSATPISTITDTAPANKLTAGTSLSTSSQTWGGSPAAKYYISKAVTTQLKGYVKCRVAIAKASTTLYVDPKITVS